MGSVFSVRELWKQTVPDEQSEIKSALRVAVSSFGLFQIAFGKLKWELLHIY